MADASSEKNNDALQANMFFPCCFQWRFTVGAGVKVTEKLGIDLGYMYSPEAKVESFGGESKMTQYPLIWGFPINSDFFRAGYRQKLYL